MSCTDRNSPPRRRRDAKARGVALDDRRRPLRRNRDNVGTAWTYPHHQPERLGDSHDQGRAEIHHHVRQSGRPGPTGSAAVRRLRDRVVAASAERGFYVTPRSFTADAQFFAETAPFN